LSYEIFNFNSLWIKHSESIQLKKEFKKLKLKSTTVDSVFTFLEVDYYTNTIVIVKDLSELTSEDFYLLITEFYNLKKIKDYI